MDVRFLLICLVLMVVYPRIGWAQTDPNPFEIKSRLPQLVLSGIDSARAAVNPFDVKPHRPPQQTETRPKLQARDVNIRQWLPQGPGLSKSGLFWIMIAATAFLTFTIALNRAAVERAWRSFLSDNGLAVAQREASGLAGNTPYIFLYVNFLINAALFIFLIVGILGGSEYNSARFLIACILLAGVMFLFKHLLLSVLKVLFPLGGEVAKYNFLIVVFNCVLGLFLSPFNFILAFTDSFKLFLAFWAVGLTAIFYIYRSLRAFQIASRFFIANFFHFLLYLCTVEIAPVLLLVKILLPPAS